MKIYEQAIQFLADQVEHGDMRYHKWAPAKAIAYIYGVSEVVVHQDLQFELDTRESRRKAERKAQHREENEKRRLANLAKV